MKKDVITGSLLVLLLSFSFSCKKAPGQGGTSTIKGRVREMIYNAWPSPGTYYGSSYIPEEHIYIIYGDTGYFADDIKTSFDGSFEFNFLNKGKYTVITYSDCDTCLSGKLANLLEVDIAKGHSTLDLGDLIIYKIRK